MSAPSSTPSRSMSKSAPSKLDHTTVPLTKNITAAPLPGAQPLYFRRQRQRQPLLDPYNHETHDRKPLVHTKEAAVQTSEPPPSPPLSSRFRWGSMRSAHLSPTKTATSSLAAQPLSPPAVERLKDQPSEAWQSRRPRIDPSSSKTPSFTKGSFPAISSSSSNRSSSADSWRLASGTSTRTSDPSSSAHTAPSFLNFTAEALDPASRNRASPERHDFPGNDPSSSSPSPVPVLSPAAPPRMPGGYLSWRGTGSSHSAGVVPAFALAVAPPPVVSNVQPPRLRPAFSPPPTSPSSESQLVKSLETTSSTASTLRSKRRGKRSKNRKDDKVSEVSAPSSSPTSSS